MTKAPCPVYFTEWSLNERHVRRSLSSGLDRVDSAGQ